MEESKPHVVAVPFMGQGHLIPFMELAKLLASQGLTVSYITTPGNAKRLEPQFQGSNLDIRLVTLPMPSVEGLPPGVESSDNVPYNFFEKLVDSSHKLAGPFEEWLEQQMSAKEIPHYPPAISCIIGDMTTGWIHRSGDKFGIPIVVFYTAGAFAWSVMHSVFNYMPQKSVEGDDELFDVPELSFDLKMRKSDLTPAQRDPDSFPRWAFVTESINQSMEGRGILINTFYELDSSGIHQIRSLTRKPVWSIGPILSPAAFDDTVIDRRFINSRGKAADIDEEECLRWLYSRPPQSVVFVCLGSQFILNDKQICALATGLEGSGQAFVWAITRPQTEPKPTATEVGLPKGFEERTRDRGLIIWGWAPQLLILSHPSIGAFLSHCGWNSTLESVSMGIPMITWPMIADQPYNSKLLEERLGVAIRICAGVNSVPNEEEVRRAVTMLLAEEEGKTMRRKAQELRKHAKIAVNKEGSSFTDLQDFVRDMQQLHQNRIGMPEFEG
uniref:Glycosyltransferase n=1 Tax=Picea sitchensis TaxID=3332 RepID=B8LPJ2_PICSI|nr:unknown [Picea sitchensis]